MHRSLGITRSILLSVASVLLAISVLSTSAPRAAAAGEPAEALIFQLIQRSLDDRSPTFGPATIAPDSASPEPTLIDGVYRDFALRLDCAPGESGLCAVEIRRFDAGPGLTITIRTDGSWSIGVPGSEPIATAEPEAIARDWSRPLRLDILAIGSTGSFAVDGAFVAPIDLTGASPAGALAVGGDDAAGSGYDGVTIWDLNPASTAESGTPVPTGPAAVFLQALQDVQGTAPAAGPSDGSLQHVENQVAFFRLGVAESDFAAHLECDAPVEGITLWDCGIAFRLGASAGEQLRLILIADGRWTLAEGVSSVIQSGVFDAASVADSGMMVLDLLVYQSAGAFSVNGAYVASLDLSSIGSSGDIAAGAAFFGSTFVADAATPFREFSLWNLDGDPFASPPVAEDNGDDGSLAGILRSTITAEPPVFGPVDGTLAHDPQDVSLQSSAVSLQNAAAQIACIAPDRAGSQLWDCGLVLRSPSSESQVRIVVVADGYWSARAADGSLIAEGNGLPIDNSPGAPLRMTVLSLAETGFLFVDDQFIARFDLPQVTTPGDILAGTAFFNETFAEGGDTAFSGFTVWSVDVLVSDGDAQSGTPAAQRGVESTPVPESTPMATGAAASPVPAGSPSPLALADLTAQEAPGVGSADLIGTQSGEVGGYAVLIRVARSVDVTVLVANGQPGDRVVIQLGSCEALERSPGAIDEVGRLDDRGIVSAIVQVRLTELLNRESHAIVLYAASDFIQTTPLACGTIEAGA